MTRRSKHLFTGRELHSGAGNATVGIPSIGPTGRSSGLPESLPSPLAFQARAGRAFQPRRGPGRIVTTSPPLPSRRPLST